MSDETMNDESAFPVTIGSVADGMTFRQYLIAKAMQSMLSNLTLHQVQEERQRVAHLSYMMADTIVDYGAENK